jgi:hypothetical protein
MRLLPALALLLLAVTTPTATTSAMGMPSFHTKGTPTGTPDGPLQPGEYWWHPEISPSGPIMVLVSVPNQILHVYRNGVLIGRSTVSTGTKGHATPGGVFTILEKKQTHRSKTYNNAPMPNMQRLTWDGIAMHSGNLPGHPASHGCIRLPYDFSLALFKLTAKGGTVVIGDGKTPTPHLAANPGLMLAPKDFNPEMLKPQGANDYTWLPERSASGPITIVVSAADKALYVFRNGNPIGRASVQISDGGLFGTRKELGNHVFTLLEGTTDKPSFWAPGRTARPWMRVTSSGPKMDVDDLGKRLTVNPEFATKLYDTIAPGTTVIVTDHAAVRNAAPSTEVLGH